MKNMTEKEVREGFKATPGPEITIPFCLERIFEDTEHEGEDLVVADMSFKELIGALLQAEDILRQGDWISIEDKIPPHGADVLLMWGDGTVSRSNVPEIEVNEEPRPRYWRWTLEPEDVLHHEVGEHVT